MRRWRSIKQERQKAQARNIERLIVLLEQAISILDPLDLGKDQWANWFRADAERLRQGDLGGAKSVLGAYGGMCSLSDEVAVTPGAEQGDLFSEIYTLAQNVHRKA